MVERVGFDIKGHGDEHCVDFGNGNILRISDLGGNEKTPKILCKTLNGPIGCDSTCKQILC
jgi:hypothetical protein